MQQEFNKYLLPYKIRRVKQILRFHISLTLNGVSGWNYDTILRDMCSDWVEKGKGVSDSQIKRRKCLKQGEI